MIDIHAIFNEVKANRAKLDSCDKHIFEPSMFWADSKWPKKYKCKKCGGTVDVTEYFWYERGLNHGGQKNDEK